MADSCSTHRQVDIAIIGAGIGGAAAAVALQKAGFAVDLFEQAVALREVGGAIVIREPSMALFGHWGVLDWLRPKMVAVNHVEIRDNLGNIQGSVPTALDAAEAEFAYGVHRADVHDALVSQIEDRRLHLGHRLASIQNFADHAEATFENGCHIRARLIVGADGLRSVVRAALDATPLTFLNLVAHRTIAPALLMPADMPADRIRLWQAGERRLNLIPIRGGAEIAISAALPAQTAPQELWSAASADEILSVYADFAPLIGRLIEARTTEISTHPIYDKAPIDRWTDRHIVLLGDAAHPMAPMNGQGANQAIQDADVLAAALSGHHRDDLMSALLAYQSIRAPVTARIQLASRNPPKALGRLAASPR